jgi:hypothetical protein
MKSGRTQVEIIALYEELGSYRAVDAVRGTQARSRLAPAAERDPGWLTQVLSSTHSMEIVAYCQTLAGRLD